LKDNFRAYWEFVFGDKKDVFFLSNKFEEIRAKKTIF